MNGTSGVITGPVGSASVTTPITVGFLAAASSVAASDAIGASPGTTETPQDAFAFFVNALNAQGGVDGRKVQVVEDFVDPESTDYNSQASSACADFTQDHHVAIVFSVEGYFYSPNFSACLQRAGVPEFLATTGGVDSETLAQYPALWSITAPTVQRRYRALVTGMAQTGFFNKQSKIGIVVEDCSFDENAYNEVIAPQLRALGFTTFRRDVSCITGFGDASSAISQIQAEVLPFRADGVDRVVFVSGFEPLMAEYFQDQAQTQGYSPSYALTSDSSVGANAMGFSPQAMARVQGVGWDPDEDLTNATSSSPSFARCHALWKGYSPAASRGNLLNNDTTCEEFFALEAVLKLSNGNSSESSVLADMKSLGNGLVSVIDLDGAATFTAAKKDGPDLYATFAYGQQCQCFQYTSSPKVMS